MSLSQDFRQEVEKMGNAKVQATLQSRGKGMGDVPRKYVIYVRKSTSGKKKDRHGRIVERQEKSIQDQLKAYYETLTAINQREIEKAKRENNPYKPFDPLKIDVYKDEESAKIPNLRDSFSTLIKKIHTGQYNTIVAWHPNRLARNMKEAGEIIDMLDQGILVDLVFASYTFTRDEYVQEMRQDLQERKRTLTTQHTNLDTRIGKLEEEYSEML